MCSMIVYARKMDCLYLGCELARNILYIRHNGFEVLEQGIALSSEHLWIVVEAVFCGQC